MTLKDIDKPSLDHLQRLTTSLGLYEHALLHEPRPEHGYCVDDVARGLLFLCREPQLDPTAEKMLDIYLNFTLSAISEDGRCRNRMDVNGAWTDEPATGDWWGRACWGLGFAAIHAPIPTQRTAALDGFRKLSKAPSSDLRAISFAALGAGEILLELPKESDARNILHEAEPRLQLQISADWYWPETRLGYSNASLAEAAMITGEALGHDPLIKCGLKMLEFLLSIETKNGHFSPTPVGGRGPDDLETQFDQQPIEIAAIADASSRAWKITGDSRWLKEIERAWLWFLGDNDVGVVMLNPETGGGFDGLHDHGPNQNQGAESTMAMLSTAQQFYRFFSAVNCLRPVIPNLR